MKNYYKPYTTKDIKLMREMRSNGLSIQDMADALDRSYNGVSEALKCFGIASKNKVMSKFEMAIIMSGDKPQLISKIIGVSPSVVSQARYRNKKLRVQNER